MATGKFVEGMAPDAEAAWRAANRATLELGHSWLGTEHLLLGLLAGAPDDPVVRALGSAGVTGAAVRAALETDLAAGAGLDERTLLAGLGIDLDAVRARMVDSFGPDGIDALYVRRWRAGRRLARGPLCGIGMAPRAKLALDHARRAAKAARRPGMNSTDLLLGVLEIEDGMAARLLRRLDVDPTAVRAALQSRAA